MRHQTTQQNTPVVKTAIGQANKLVGLQLLFTGLLALVWGFFNKHAILSVLYGGVACLLPNLCLARHFFRRMHTKPKRIVAAFYMGEMLKLFASALLLFFAILLLHAIVLPLIVGYLVASSGFWFAPKLLISQQHPKGAIA